jgi:predicted 3-demethylubiquinone-9 3-methyltransferase (glyoxalase superfamily)
VSLEFHRVTPFLWYDGQAEEAARHYVSVFKTRSQVVSVSPMSVTFELEGQPFIAPNGGSTFKFSEAVSLFVHCKDQREVDYYWRRLGEGGKSGQCGWLKDRWGLSWQVVPQALNTCLNGRDKAGAQRAMEAMLGMGKLDVKGLREAYAGNGRARNADTRLRKGTADMGAQKGKKSPRAVARPTDDGAPRSDVEVFLASKAHPLEAEINQLRKLMLGLSPSIREEVKWNSVSFRSGQRLRRRVVRVARVDCKRAHHRAAVPREASSRPGRSRGLDEHVIRAASVRMARIYRTDAARQRASEIPPWVALSPPGGPQLLALTLAKPFPSLWRHSPALSPAPDGCRRLPSARLLPRRP